MQAAQEYDFPVSLQPLFTKSGKTMPKVQAVVRDDTAEPLSHVSMGYKLVPHRDVLNAAESFVKTLGEPKRNIYLNKNGATITGEYTYADKSVAVGVGDVVGLRVYVENSYNSSMSLRVRVGALVLRCMNGMMVPRDIYSMTFRHVGAREIHWPHPEEIIGNFQAEGKKWNTYAKNDLGDKYQEYADKAVQDQIVVQKALEAPTLGTTVWDLYNQFTHHITHNESKTASPIGKIARAERVARWFDGNFGS